MFTTQSDPFDEEFGVEVETRPYGDYGVLFTFGDASIVAPLHRAVVSTGLAEESIPGASTLFVEQRLLSHSGIVELVATEARALVSSGDGAILEPETHVVHIRYDGEDLEDVSRISGLSVPEVIAAHRVATYTVAFLGFSRGFPYLRGLDPRLVVPRLSVPRTLVPTGSVGLGAEFTGIYPAATPGGWRLIGRTDAVLFDEHRDPPSFLRPGDYVRFVEVDA